MIPDFEATVGVKQMSHNGLRGGLLSSDSGDSDFSTFLLFSFSVSVSAFSF